MPKAMAARERSAEASRVKVRRLRAEEESPTTMAAREWPAEFSQETIREAQPGVKPALGLGAARLQPERSEPPAEALRRPVRLRLRVLAVRRLCAFCVSALAWPEPRWLPPFLPRAL